MASRPPDSRSPKGPGRPCGRLALGASRRKVQPPRRYRSGPCSSPCCPDGSKEAYSTICTCRHVFQASAIADVKPVVTAGPFQLAQAKFVRFDCPESPVLLPKFQSGTPEPMPIKRTSRSPSQEPRPSTVTSSTTSRHTLICVEPCQHRKEGRQEEELESH